MPLSVAMITRNAAGQLERCLASVAFAEEVVVVDSGSTDDTVELAARHGARVIRKEWLGFGAQKQFAVDAASHEWVLCVDADESLSPELRDAIVRELKAPRGLVYAIPRRNRFLGRWLKHGEGYPDWNVRLFHREHARWGSEATSCTIRRKLWRSISTSRTATRACRRNRCAPRGVARMRCSWCSHPFCASSSSTCGGSVSSTVCQAWCTSRSVA